MPAPRFHDGQRGATYSVRVVVTGGDLRIVDTDNVTLAVWDLARVAAAPEIDPDGAVTITDRGQPGVLLVDDSTDLETLRRAGIGLPTRKAWTHGKWAIVVAALVAAIGMGVLAVTTLPRWVAGLIPVAWEQRLGAPAAAMLTMSSSRCAGAAGQAALDGLVGRLRAAGAIEMPVSIVVIDDRLINAFTLPGGQILLMRGLIEDATDGPMLAGVIGHELGHVAHRDSATMLLRAMGMSMLLHMIGLGDAGGFAASSATNLMNLSYSRAAEAAADATAIDLLTKTGMRADGLSRFFARREGHAGTEDAPASKPVDRGGMMLEWFATHPASAARRQTTARPETGEPPFTDAEWRAIRTMCAR